MLKKYIISDLDILLRLVEFFKVNSAPISRSHKTIQATTLIPDSSDTNLPAEQSNLSYETVIANLKQIKESYQQKEEQEIATEAEGVLVNKLENVFRFIELKLDERAKAKSMQLDKTTKPTSGNLADLVEYFNKQNESIEHLYVESTNKKKKKKSKVKLNPETPEIPIPKQINQQKEEILLWIGQHSELTLGFFIDTSKLKAGLEFSSNLRQKVQEFNKKRDFIAEKIKIYQKLQEDTTNLANYLQQLKTFNTMFSESHAQQDKLGNEIRKTLSELNLEPEDRHNMARDKFKNKLFLFLNNFLKINKDHEDLSIHKAQLEKFIKDLIPSLKNTGFPEVIVNELSDVLLKHIGSGPEETIIFSILEGVKSVKGRFTQQKKDTSSQPIDQHIVFDAQQFIENLFNNYKAPSASSPKELDKRVTALLDLMEKLNDFQLASYSEILSSKVNPVTSNESEALYKKLVENLELDMKEVNKELEVAPKESTLLAFKEKIENAQMMLKLMDPEQSKNPTITQTLSDSKSINISPQMLKQFEDEINLIRKEDIAGIYAKQKKTILVELQFPELIIEFKYLPNSELTDRLITNFNSEVKELNVPLNELKPAIENKISELQKEILERQYAEISSILKEHEKKVEKVLSQVKFLQNKGIEYDSIKDIEALAERRVLEDFQKWYKDYPNDSNTQGILTKQKELSAHYIDIEKKLSSGDETIKKFDTHYFNQFVAPYQKEVNSLERRVKILNASELSTQVGNLKDKLEKLRQGDTSNLGAFDEEINQLKVEENRLAIEEKYTVYQALTLAQITHFSEHRLRLFNNSSHTAVRIVRRIVKIVEHLNKQLEGYHTSLSQAYKTPTDIKEILREQEKFFTKLEDWSNLLDHYLIMAESYDPKLNQHLKEDEEDKNKLYSQYQQIVKDLKTISNSELLPEPEKTKIKDNLYPYELEIANLSLEETRLKIQPSINDLQIKLNAATKSLKESMNAHVNKIKQDYEGKIETGAAYNIASKTEKAITDFYLDEAKKAKEDLEKTFNDFNIDKADSDKTLADKLTEFTSKKTKASTAIEQAEKDLAKLESEPYLATLEVLKVIEEQYKKILIEIPHNPDDPNNHLLKLGVQSREGLISDYAHHLLETARNIARQEVDERLLILATIYQSFSAINSRYRRLPGDLKSDPRVANYGLLPSSNALVDLNETLYKKTLANAVIRLNYSGMNGISDKNRSWIKGIIRTIQQAFANLFSSKEPQQIEASAADTSSLSKNRYATYSATIGACHTEKALGKATDELMKTIINPAPAKG